MVPIKIKGINGQYHMYITQMGTCLSLLSQRLEEFSLRAKHNGSVFFHFDAIHKEEIHTLFSLAAAHGVLVAGVEAAAWQKLARGIQVKEASFHNGQTYELHDELVLLGNIERQAYISTDRSLYVLGNVEGSVDLRHACDVLCAASLDGNVRICDSAFQDLTIFAPVKVYYENGQLRCKTYKEEISWEKLSQ